MVNPREKRVFLFYPSSRVIERLSSERQKARRRKRERERERKRRRMRERAVRLSNAAAGGAEEPHQTEISSGSYPKFIVAINSALQLVHDQYLPPPSHPRDEGCRLQNATGEKRERRKETRGWTRGVRDRNSEGKAGVSKLYRVACARNVYLMPSF